MKGVKCSLHAAVVTQPLHQSPAHAHPFPPLQLDMPLSVKPQVIPLPPPPLPPLQLDMSRSVKPARPAPRQPPAKRPRLAPGGRGGGRKGSHGPAGHGGQQLLEQEQGALTQDPYGLTFDNLHKARPRHSH